jgi:hypothetical protein
MRMWKRGCTLLKVDSLNVQEEGVGNQEGRNLRVNLTPRCAIDIIIS